MSTEDPIRNTLALSSGARFHLCALQVNLQHCAATYHRRAPDRDEDLVAEELRFISRLWKEKRA